MAIIERKQCMPPEGDDHSLFLDWQSSRLRGLRPSSHVVDWRPLPPLRNCLLIDAIAIEESPQTLLTMLYRATDCLSRRGAPMKKLAYSASFHPSEKIAPSSLGIKHLAEAFFLSIPQVW